MGAAMFAIFFVLLIFGFPLFEIIGLSTLFPLLAGSDVTTPSYIIRAMFSGVDSLTILAIPLFMFSGNIMAKGGISKKIFDVFSYLVGNKTAGLPIAVIITCVFYGAICGSGPATTAAVGSMAIPLLLANGYDKNFCGALICAAGSIGIIIPPSTPMMTFGVMTDTSVGNLFTAGIIPGLLIALCLIIYVIIYCKKNGEDKALILENYKKLKERSLGRVILDGFWALLTPVIILGGIYGGVVTPTEAAVLSVVYAIIISAFVYKTMNFKQFIDIVITTVKSYAMVGVMVGFAIGFSRMLNSLRVPTALANFMLAHFQSKNVLILGVIVFLLLIGMVMDVNPAITILAPMLMPVLTAYGVDPVQFGIVCVCCLGVGLFSPPYGLNLFVAEPIAGTTVSGMMKFAFIFAGVFIIGLLLIAFIPQISLFLVYL